MSKRLLDYDDLTGVSTFFDYDENSDTTFIGYEQDVEPILEANKASQNDSGQLWRGEDNDFWRVASVPAVVQMKWLNEHGVDLYNNEHWPAVRRLLNSSDYAYLKTASKRI